MGTSQCGKWKNHWENNRRKSNDFETNGKHKWCRIYFGGGVKMDYLVYNDDNELVAVIKDDWCLVCLLKDNGYILVDTQR
jgi:hypothetical protein